MAAVARTLMAGTKRLISEFSRLGTPRAPAQERIGDLTERETEVLVLVAQGLSNGEIFARLSEELARRRFRAPTYSERQLRRMIYG